MESNSGYIYVLVNSAMPDLVKVGFTTRSPVGRAKELGAVTGVPVPFIVAYERPVANCQRAERLVHRALEEKGFRVAENREFFRAPLATVIESVMTLPTDVLDAAQASTHPDGRSTEDHPSNQFAWLDLWEQARDAHYGTDNELEDRSYAAQLYSDALQLGCSWAYFPLAEFALNSDHGQRGLSDAQRIARLGVQAKNYVCYVTHGHIAARRGDFDGARKAVVLLLKERQRHLDEELERQLQFNPHLTELILSVPEVLDDLDKESQQALRQIGAALLSAANASMASRMRGSIESDELEFFSDSAQKLKAFMSAG
jgi:hypothetical protein